MSAAPAKRSRNGCWTCKRRRRKCDESHPTCATCHDNNLVCEGYEPRLRWDIGVASRGYLTGASKPTVDHAPPRQKGRQRDLLKRERENTGSPTAGSLSGGDHVQQSSPSSASTRSNATGTPELVLDSLNLRGTQKERLFQEFMTSGIKYLHATELDDSPLLPMMQSLCERSDILYDVCVTCQAYLSYGPNSLFYELYSETLSKFRAGIDHPLMKTDAAILNAALLLCTIGILQGTPWTIHIRGMERLMDERANLSPLADPEPALIQAIEVMGIFDLRAFVIGRQTPSLDMWRRYRQGQLIRFAPSVDSVEPVTGIPRSMIDLLARDDDPLAEENIWLWPGCTGSLLQCQLWDAYRYATMLNLRRQSKHRDAILQTQPQPQQPKSILPDDHILLTRALSALDAVHNGARKSDTADSLVLGALLYPLFIIGAEVFVSSNEERKDLITGWFNNMLEENSPFANPRQAWEILQVVAAKHKEGMIASVDEIARSRQIEVGLF